MSHDQDAPTQEDVAFLSVEEVKDLHVAVIRRFSPGESVAIRDTGLLESAVMNPQQSFGGQYVYPSLADMAAAYLVGLALNHAFENGNKRIAFAACSVFLRVNGYCLTLTQDQAVELTFNVVKKLWDREKAAQVIDAAMREL